MQNDAVVQGLSQAPSMRDVRKWAALTIGTGLGNASFRKSRSARNPQEDVRFRMVSGKYQNSGRMCAGRKLV